MKKIKIAFLIILIFRFGVSAQNDVSKAKWQSKKIVVDGNNKEWNKPLNFYSLEIGQVYSISNDSSHLFLCFISSDALKTRKLIMAGWQIDLSSKEKNSKFSSSIIFPPIKIDDGEKKDNAISGRNMNDYNAMINTYKLEFSGVTTKGFKSKNGNLPLKEQGGINIGVGSDSLQNLCYEISIPLKELIAENLLQLNELITLNVKVNGLASPSSGGGNRNTGYGGRSEGENYDGGNYGGGQRGMYGGMYGGRQGGYYQGGQYGDPGPGGKSDLFLKGKAKQKFVLAGK